MKAWLCVSLFMCALLTGCERGSWVDKDFAFLIAKLESRSLNTRIRAIEYLEDKTEQRERVIAALTHKLLNDTHENVRGRAARALGSMTPPTAEAVPALKKALHFPKEDRGKPLWDTRLPRSTNYPLPYEAARALEKIGTPEALKAVDEFKKLQARTAAPVPP